MAWKLYEGNCFYFFPEIDDKSIDMVICDLPYGVTSCRWDTPLPLDKLWFEYKRIIKDNGAIVLTASQPFTTRLISSNYDMFKYSWVWNKEISGSFANAKRSPMKIHEDILVFSKLSHKYFPIMVSADPKNVRPINKGSSMTESTFNHHGTPKSSEDYNPLLRYPSSIINCSRRTMECNGLNILHPTQKPVKLFEYLIKTYTNENELVLDNCAGSGTTGVACQNLNRDCILMEQEPEYCEIIRNRMKEAEELQLESRKQQTLDSFSGQQTLTSHAK